jgi:hypothetical protein
MVADVNPNVAKRIIERSRPINEVAIFQYCGAWKAPAGLIPPPRSKESRWCMELIELAAIDALNALTDKLLAIAASAFKRIIFESKLCCSFEFMCQKKSPPHFEI